MLDIFARSGALSVEGVSQNVCLTAFRRQTQGKKKKGCLLIFMSFQIDVFDSCVTQMFLHSCVTQILTDHVHDARFCDLEHVANTLTLPFCMFSRGSMLMFLKDRYLTF